MIDKQNKEKISLRIRGMHCASCITRVEGALREVPGVVAASVNLADGSAVVTTVTDTPITQALVEAVKNVGYTVRLGEDAEAEEDDAEAELTGYRRRTIVAIVIAVVVMILTMDFIVRAVPPIAGIPNPVRNWIALILTAVSIAWAGREFYVIAWKALLRFTAEMNTLVSVGTGAAFVYSAIVTIAPGVFGTTPDEAMVYFDSAATIIALILLGRYFETKAKNRAGGAVRALLDLAPKTAFRMDGDEEKEVPVKELKIGDLIRVKPGGQIAADGVVVRGESTIDESLLTGESEAVHKQVEDTVSAGTINLVGSLDYRIEKAGAETVLGQIITATRQAQTLKPPIARTVDRIAAIFVPVVIFIAIASAVIWSLVPEAQIPEDLQGMNLPLITFISVLIISCPCALGLATPTAILVASGIGAKYGILIKDGPALEVAGWLGTIVLDKTGTITEGHPSVTNVIPMGEFTEDEVVRYAASVEQLSEHPAAKAIMDEAKKRNLKLREAEQFTAEIGQGVKAKVGGAWIRIGSQELFDSEGIEIDEDLSARADVMATEVKTPLFIVRGQHPVGLIAIQDQIKPDAAVSILMLKRLGLKPVLCTGDQEKVARSVAAAVGITNVKSEIGPQDKAAIVARLKLEGKEGRTWVAMIGDGINDAVALTEADIGMAMGTGSDVALQAGNFVLVRSDLRSVVAAIELSRDTMATINSNLVLAFIYNVLAIPLAAGILIPFTGSYGMHPMIAAIAMSLSSISVVTNSLRLNTFKPS